jgi:hypothetical protein
MIDNLGKIIGKKSVQLNKGANQIDWNIQAIEGGNYSVVDEGGKYMLKKIIKL